MRVKALLVLFCSIFFVGCSGPKDYDIAKLTEDQKKELGQKLTSDEGQKLAGWMLRNVLSGKGESTTVGNAIKAQEQWLAEQKVEEAKAAEIKKRVDAERLLKQAEFAKLLSVVLVNKHNSLQEYDRKFVDLEIAFDNKSDKDIAGVKGVLRITDMFGDKIVNLKWSNDEGVASKQTLVERGSGMRINQFMDDHMKLWNMDYDKLKSTIEVSTIIFKDGTKIDAPE